MSCSIARSHHFTTKAPADHVRREPLIASWGIGTGRGGPAWRFQRDHVHQVNSSLDFFTFAPSHEARARATIDSLTHPRSAPVEIPSGPRVPPPGAGASPYSLGEVCSRTALTGWEYFSAFGGATPTPRPAGLRPPDPPPLGCGLQPGGLLRGCAATHGSSAAWLRPSTRGASYVVAPPLTVSAGWLRCRLRFLRCVLALPPTGARCLAAPLRGS